MELAVEVPYHRNPKDTSHTEKTTLVTLLAAIGLGFVITYLIAGPPLELKTAENNITQISEYGN